MQSIVKLTQGLSVVQGRVVSGHKQVLGEVQTLAIAQGAMKVTPLAVSGAFHTPLMQPAQDKLKEACTTLLLQDHTCMHQRLYRHVHA